jgi:hypothetical protein
MGSWTVQPVSVETLLRDSVCPIPDTAKRHLYHATSNVITLGGANGTVGWVDLWRGILLCDVLEERPKLRDMPLPLPAKGNWRRFLGDGERFVRDITVSQHKDSIKYVEMEIVPPRVVMNTASSPEPATYAPQGLPASADALRGPRSVEGHYVEHAYPGHFMGGLGAPNAPPSRRNSTSATQGIVSCCKSL